MSLPENVENAVVELREAIMASTAAWIDYLEACRTHDVNLANRMDTKRNNAQSRLEAARKNLETQLLHKL